MTKKKPKASTQSTEKTAAATATATASTIPTPIVAGQQTATSAPTPPTQALTTPSTLVICRNKHWRHISSYHGPWLNLPPEVLESLAFSNFYSPRPRPIDPAVFFDLVKIRRLIDDATSLAVRAANGTTSASLHTSMNAANGIFNGSDAEILGIGSVRGGGNAKLSRERKHRMREHATQKLSHAYQLDEIAASVATMQAASAIDDVARHVLQRNVEDPDAQYVHFFHEKVPSLAMPQYTTLDPLNHVIRQKPTEASPYRTRAVARVFKDDLEGAARDCTEGLAVHRLYQPQRQNGQRGLVLANEVAKYGREHPLDGRVEEKDQPSSLEPQLLFHRGGAYLTLACDHIGRALGEGRQHASASVSRDLQDYDGTAGDPLTEFEKEEARSRAEARKLVRTYAKRALRDYTAFLSHFDYTPGLSAEYTDAFLEKLSSTTLGASDRSRSERLLDIDAHARSGLAEALVKYESQKNGHQDRPLPPIPKPAVHKLNALFAAVPPTDIPPYPPASDSLKDPDHPAFSLPDFSEAVTYHPLLMDVLHSLLLCHCLLQTSTKEHLRHAHMAARIVRICDGYPIFLAPRSPARADWIEILRRSKNWLGLDDTWERLCSPVPLPEHDHKPRPTKRKEGNLNGNSRDQAKQGDIKEAMVEERMMAQETFRTGVKARELKTAQKEDDAARKEQKHPKADEAHAKEKAIAADVLSRSMRTERAEAISRWVMEAPPLSSADGTSRSKKKVGAKARLRKAESTISSLRGSGLEQSVDSLDLVD
ncbi:hypothetical protein A1O1_06465 [Capronia coronata CBS 617.96]|uniref:Uncharacterized protein n=1 Tax=Capronia coronata CBS 617.96 TaxID=1182541 RepID=W9YA15_9EURO|nr:uncharacterized protein A1O1_06465 [Capronia coronata CBS 617.96]EXJ86096.1 hypothetical protein A1O1_06465 [Capronia coronata CBS 617.96]